MHGFDAGWGAIRHWGVSDGTDEVRPLWQSHSAQMEIFFADEVKSSEKHYRLPL